MLNSGAYVLRWDFTSNAPPSLTPVRGCLKLWRCFLTILVFFLLGRKGSYLELEFVPLWHQSQEEPNPSSASSLSLRRAAGFSASGLVMDWQRGRRPAADWQSGLRVGRWAVVAVNMKPLWRVKVSVVGGETSPVGGWGALSLSVCVCVCRISSHIKAFGTCDRNLGDIKSLLQETLDPI